MPTDTTDTVTMSARQRTLLDRAERDYANLLANGMDTSRTFYPPGTEAAVATRAGTVAKYRTKHEARPLASEALAALVDTVLAEDRQDREVWIGDALTRPTPDPGGQAAPGLDVSGLGGLYMTTYGPSGPQFMAPTDRVMTQLMAKHPAGHPVPRGDIATWLPYHPGHAAKLRHRKLPAARRPFYQGDHREAFALVSPSYVPYDLNEAAADLAAAVPHDARATVRYDGSRATVDVVLQNPYYLDGGDAAAVGETHRVVLRMRTADDGSSGYHLSLLAERVRCVNLTLLHARRSLFSGTHRQAGLRDLVQQALEQVRPTMETFAETWRAAWTDYWVDRYTREVLDGETALRRIVACGKYRIPGLGADGTLDAVLAALAQEPGDSRAHVHNALTLAAHQAPTTWASRWADEEAEEQASALLYQSVRWLPEPEPEVE